MSNTLSTRFNGKLEVMLSSIILLSITNFFPMYFKTWFVEPTGNFQISPFLGLLFGLGLIWKKNWARTGALILSWGILAISLIFIFTDGSRPGFWLLMVLSSFLLYLLSTAQLKRYFDLNTAAEDED